MLIAFVAAWRGRTLRARWAWGLIGAGLLNSYWLAYFRGDPSGRSEITGTLGVGYFCWWLSFFVVAIALWPAGKRQ